jgi:hypothetical protein
MQALADSGVKKKDCDGTDMSKAEAAAGATVRRPNAVDVGAKALVLLAAAASRRRADVNLMVGKGNVEVNRIEMECERMFTT